MWPPVVRVGAAIGILVAFVAITLGMDKEHLIVRWWDADGTALLLFAIILLQLLILLLIVFRRSD